MSNLDNSEVDPTKTALLVTLLVVLTVSSSTSFNFFCKSMSLSVTSPTLLIYDQAKADVADIAAGDKTFRSDVDLAS